MRLTKNLLIEENYKRGASGIEQRRNNFEKHETFRKGVGQKAKNISIS